MKTQSRLYRTTSLLLLLGVASVVLWLWLSGGTPAPTQRSVRPLGVALLVSTTAACVLLRFVRWQFLLRRTEVRVPARRSLTIYLASLCGIATPAYVGELLRAVLIRREGGGGLRAPLAVVVLERLLDVAALATLGALVSRGGWTLLVMVAVIGGAALAGRAAYRFAARGGFPVGFLREVGRPRILLFSYVLSLASWAAAATAISLAAACIGLTVGLADGMRVFANATLGGGISLLPAGVAVTGSLAIVQLQSLSLSLPDAILAASVFRFGTVGVTLIVAFPFAAREWMLVRRRRAAPEQHFDEIAGEYLHQFSPHIWDLLLGRKLGLVTDALPAAGAAAGLGLDLGCGLGHQCRWLSERGYNVVGLDYAYGLLKFAKSNGGAVVNGSATALPFADNSVDFVYTIGVLHHLPTRADQLRACQEVARVLKPGGRFMVHETNPRNPVFRFYMGYVFPILKSIDEGTERWLLPRRWSNLNGLELVDVRYFTFLPDFIPRRLMRPFLQFERWLERSPLRPYSVHYMAVLQKQTTAPGAAIPSVVELEHV